MDTVYAHQHELSVVFPTDISDSLHILMGSPLFRGVAREELLAMLHCLGVEEARYTKHQYVYRAGEKVTTIGFVLSGRIYGVRIDFWGNRNLLSTAEPGDLFGESWACTQTGVASADMVAAEASRVLFFNVQRVITVCGSACSLHTRVISNILQVVAGQNLDLMRKIEHTTQRTTRGKLLSYLSEQARRTGSTSFSIPFNRQELADYLSVERSAMSAELGRLRKEGLLEFDKDRFTLLHGGYTSKGHIEDAFEESESGTLVTAVTSHGV